MVILPIVKLGLGKGSWFGRQKYFLGIFAQFVLREDESSHKSGSVANVVIHIILGQVKDILGQKLGLLRVTKAKFDCQVKNLKLDLCVFVRK